jgi:thioredoxin-related protein
MKSLLLVLALFAGTVNTINAQEKTTLYNPKADAAQDLKIAIAKAGKEHKNVFIQVGGNWCIWCTRFHATVKNNDTLTRLMQENYVTVHLNYSPENKNETLLATLGYPQRVGDPVFVILDAKGKRIHTQNSAYLEEGKGYDNGKIAEFLKQWSPTAIDPATYQKTKS